MCGIFGVINEKNSVEITIEALKKLEYRGYDSAGIVTINEVKKFESLKSLGKIAELEQNFVKNPIRGSIALGHTRWATHGKPSEINAHPHIVGKVAVVHNGIIENYLDLKQKLVKESYNFISQTDTEIIAAHIDYLLKSGRNEIEAVRESLYNFRGNYAIAVLFEGRDDLIIVAKNHSPLVIGFSKEQKFISSDFGAIANYAEEAMDLEDGDMAIITKENLIILDNLGQEQQRNIVKLEKYDSENHSGSYPNFMLKEIYEQPSSIRRIIGKYFNLETMSFNNLPDIDFGSIETIDFVACGSSFHAANVAKYWFEDLTNIRLNVDIASEYRYRTIRSGKKGNLVMFISQSGETADSLASLKHAKLLGYQTLSLLNVARSSMAKLSDHVMMLEAGEEIGVASTKAFTAQLSVLLILALKFFSLNEKCSNSEIEKKIQEFSLIPSLIEKILADCRIYQIIAEEIKNLHSILYIGRNNSYPIVSEGALKLKELSYIHAESFAAGELKHGSIALIDENSYVVVMALSDKLFEKIFSNIQEVKARNAKTIVICNEDNFEKLKDFSDIMIILPFAPDHLFDPLLMVIPLQFIAYQTSLSKNCDVDRPRNLAKSVTVE